MKKISLIIAMLVVISTGFAQKRNVTSCWSFLKDGFYGDAKDAIDKATEHPDTKDWYKTWWYYGQTYQVLSTATKPKYQNLCDNCKVDAFNAYTKALVLNFEDEENRKLDLENENDIVKFLTLIANQETKYEDNQALMDIIGVRLPALSNGFVNEGVEHFQESEDFAKALECFEYAIGASTLSFKVDTQIYYFASLAAKKAENYAKAIEYNKALIRFKFGANEEEKTGIYYNLAMCYKETGDTTKMLETLQKGIDAYPEHSYNLIIETFNYYVNAGESEKAFEYISMAIEKNPNDPQFYVIKGTLLEDMNKKMEATKEYNKALDLDPNNFDANYSMGAFYYNSAADTLAWANENIPPTDFKAYDEVKLASNELFNLAVPYLEKCLELKDEDLNVLNTLKTVYYRIGEIEKHDAVKAKLDALVE